MCRNFFNIPCRNRENCYAVIFLFNLIFVILLVAVAFMLTVHGVYILTFQRRYYGPAPELYYPCDFEKGEEKRITAADGCILKADFHCSDKDSSTVVILLHGYRCRGTDMAPIAQMYKERFGFNVLAPDLRAHGGTGGRCITFGLLDGKDVNEWIEYCENMFGRRCRIIIHGISMGGATALFAGAYNNSRVVCVISDCAYCSAADMVRREIARNLHMPPSFLVWIVNTVVKVKGGYSIYDCSPEKIAGKIKCPVMIIHGGADEYIPPSNAYRLAAQIQSECDVYVCEGAIHAGSALKDPEKYEERIRSFLRHI